MPSLKTSLLKTELLFSPSSGLFRTEHWMEKKKRSLRDLTYILPFVKTEQGKSRVVESWMDHADRTFEDAESVLRLSDFPATESWIKRDERSLEDLMTALPQFENKSAIAKNWVNKEGRSLGDLTTILSLFKNPADDYENVKDKSSITESWISREGKSVADLAAALSLFYEFEDEFSESWINGADGTLEDLPDLLQTIGNDQRRSSITESWISEEGRTLEELVAVLALFDGFDKYSIAESWINKKDKTLEDLKAVLLLSDEEKYQSTIAESWISGEGRTLEDLNAVLSLFDDFDDKFVNSLANQEMENPEDQHLPLRMMDMALHRASIAQSWINREKRSLEDLAEIVSKYDYTTFKCAVAKFWLAKEGGTFENLTKVLSISDDPEYKFVIAASWVGGEEEKTLEDLTATLSLSDNAEYKSEVAYSWLGKEQRALEDFKVAFQFITNNSYKSVISEYWIEEEGRTLEDFTAIASLFDDPSRRSAVAKSWLKNQDPQTKYENFITLAKAGIFPDPDHYNVGKIATAFANLSLPNDKLPDLCTDLYPSSELMQTELFKEYLSRSNSLTDDLKPKLKSFVNNLKENELAFEAITALKKYCNLSPLEVLEITKNRLSSKYESVSDLLKDKSLEESLSEKGLQFVRDIFENDSSPIDINLADLFSYYDLTQNLGKFKSLLVPEILQELAQNFSPSSKTAYVSDAEFKTMGNLFNNAATPESNLQLPSVKIVTAYLSSKIGDIGKDLTPEEIDNYQFGNSKILLAESKEDLTKHFRNLLRKADPSAAEISDFFEAALNPAQEITAENRIINDDNQKKMQNFFTANKDLLALLFQQEEGLDNFTGTIVTLGDGCGANIATQSKVSLYQSLITDPCDQVLFGAFKTKISGAILNSGSDLLTGSLLGINIFQDHNINKNFISPNGLLTALSEEFFYNGKIIKNAVEFIKNEAGEEARDNLAESICEKDPTTFNQELARVAAYITLEKTIPALCENKYLSKPRAEYLEIVREGQKTAAGTGLAVEEIILTLPNSSTTPADSAQVISNIYRERM